MKRLVFGLVMVLLMMAIGVAVGETIEVSTKEELAEAVDRINAATSDEFVIILQNDIETDVGIAFNSNVKKTILGNNHTLKLVPSSGSGSVNNFIFLNDGVLNLGNESKLGLTITLGGTGSDSSSCIQVIANPANGDGDTSPVLNMYEGVTISNWKTDNSYGAAVRLHSEILNKNSTATFNMYGGTINGCGFTSGSNRFGGGVAVMHNGVFNMEGGTISGCSATSGGGVFVGMDKGVIKSIKENGAEVNEPVFNMTDGTISDNSVGDSGGGVSVTNGEFILSEGVISDNTAGRNGGGVYVYVSFNPDPVADDQMADGIFEMNGGMIQGNTAKQGGGIYSQYSWNTDPLYTVKLNGGSIERNYASTYGGGIHLVRSYMDIKDTLISRNEAGQYGGGLFVYADPATVNIYSGTNITSNKAIYGGGIFGGSGTVRQYDGGILCNNIASRSGTDYFGQAFGGNDGPNNTLSLSSATAMNQKFINGTETTRYTIDGWYWDDEDDEKKPPTYRWYYDQAFESNSKNKYVGDTIDINGFASLKAAFTPYNQIDIVKVWNDNNNRYSTRPESVTFALIDTTTNQPVKLRKWNGTTWAASGEDATITLTSANVDASDSNKWTGSIWPLTIENYDTSSYLLEETGTGALYELVRGEPTFNPDGTFLNQGVYTFPFTNKGRIPVSIYKIWDDVNNKDNQRPDSLNVDLRLNGKVITTVDNTDAAFTLTPDMNWTTTAYLPLGDYSSMHATEGNLSGRGYKGSTTVSENNDGTFTVVFVNSRILTPIDADDLQNVSTVEINYEAKKVWSGTNPVGSRQLPRPEVTVILKADGHEIGRKVIPAGKADPATVLFENIPKYKDNEGENPISYTIEEEITDSGWVKVGEEWYSLNGMGKYKGSITDVTAEDVERADKQTTLTGGTATNTYTTLQTETEVNVTKLWKDHKNENGVRPPKLTLGLFAPGATTPVKKIDLTGGSKDESWSGVFEKLPIYDTRGKVIDYSTYIIKESYDGGSTWLEYGDSHTITDDAGHTYTYGYSVVTNP